MRRHRPPTLVSMWMLDVFCCALGCVTLLWLLKTREAGQISDEALTATALVEETRGKLDESERLAALRLASADKLASDLEAIKAQLAVVRDERDKLATNLALMREERDKNARNLALVEKELDTAKQALALTTKILDKNAKELATTRTKAEDLEKMLAGVDSKLTASDAELVKKRGELENLTQQLELAKKQKLDLDMLVRNKEKARSDFESKLKESEKKLDEATRSAGDMSKMQARIDQLEKDAKAERTKLDEANVTIVDLQGTKARLADKINKLQIESDNKFAGIAMTGKNVVFLVDMSGSMERTEENVLAPDKWPGVRDALCKVMRSIPDLEKFQVILFSGKVRYLLESGDWLTYEKEKSIERVHKALSEVKPAEDTNLYAGLEEAFRYRSKGLDTVYFFSDGLPTSGPGMTAVQEKTLTNETERSAILSRHIRRTLATTWNRVEAGRPKVRINSIGFFYESPDVGAFLWALSRENDGSFVGMSKP
ncbi:MAG TPA: VWA domain-containing protein [Gemmataceae bacterium]|nr:VWA domain-containing protein [Gemmataceae bacterium]